MAHKAMQADAAEAHLPGYTPANNRSNATLPVILALLGVYLIWGSTYLAIRYAVQTIPPFLMGGCRFLLAGGLLFVLLRARGAPLPTRREWGGAAIVGGLLLLGGNGLVAVAEHSVASSLAALLVATVPIWAAVFAALRGRRPHRLEACGLAVGFLGLILLNAGTDLRSNLLGAATLIVASMSWAFGSIWSRSLPLPRGMMSSAAQMLTGGALMLLASPLHGERLTTMPSARSWWATAYLVVFGSIIAFSCYSYLLRRVRPVLATSYAYVNPVVAVALGAGTAGERVGAAGLVALVIISLGVALVIIGQPRGHG